MNPSDVFDLKRMFLGDAPPLFLVEIAVRSAFMYGYALLMLRLMGRRSMGQLSPFDFAIVIALAWLGGGRPDVLSGGAAAARRGGDHGDRRV